MQETSAAESQSTMQFGARVSEITLGAAKKNTESSAMLDAREVSGRLQREVAVAKAEAAAARDAINEERLEADRLRQEKEDVERELQSVKVRGETSTNFKSSRSLKQWQQVTHSMLTWRIPML